MICLSNLEVRHPERGIIKQSPAFDANNSRCTGSRPLTQMDYQQRPQLLHRREAIMFSSSLIRTICK